MVKSLYTQEIEARLNQYKTFINFFHHQSKKFPDRIFVRYCLNGTYQTMTYGQVDRISTHLACQWRSELTQETSVISFLGTNGAQYLLTVLALLKLNKPLLLISPRNSDAANANLLEATRSKLCIVTPDQAHRSLGIRTKIVEPFERWMQEPLNSDLTPVFDEQPNKAALIIHSSGTTRFPKPIYLSHRYMFYFALLYESIKEQHSNAINPKDVILSCAPLFHAFGFSSLVIAVTSGASLVFLEKSAPSQEDIDIALSVNQVTFFMVLPILLEGMVPYLTQKQDFTSMRRLKYAIFGGAPLKKETSLWFQKHQINVRNTIGGTEMGLVMISSLANDGDWFTVRPFVVNSNGLPYCKFESIGNDLYHLYLPGDYPQLALGVANRPDGGYSTNDLFRMIDGGYDYVGRLDDLLVHENGEKTNPIPIEACLRQSPFVKQAVVLGHQRECTAALVELNMDHAIRHDPHEILRGVYAAVEQANKECPSHSRLLSQMVRILPLNQSLPCTDKGTIKRKILLETYQLTIETLYNNLSSAPTNDTMNFLTQTVVDVLGLSLVVEPKQSLFDLGLNSLTAVQLRHVLTKRFGHLPQNFLYQYSSISAIHDFLLQKTTENPSQAQTQLLAHSYIERARSEFSVVTKKNTRKETVLLTGATGSLGSFLLRDLLQDSRVKKIYCPVRGSNRLKEVFSLRCLDPSLLETDRLEILDIRLDEPLLGLCHKRYQELKEEVDVVQHCAWFLDFNRDIQHYDRACIAPFYNLIRFAYREKPMHVYFVSSVSASARLSHIKEEPLPLDAGVCMPMGYAQSKFVCESLLSYLATEKGMPCFIQRLGQVCGDSVHGAWNTSEQFPLMITAGARMHKMPALESRVDWIPVDYASAVIADIMMGQETRLVYHVVNPQTENWAGLLKAMRLCGILFDTVDPQEWLESLDSEDPAYRLMAYFESAFKTKMKMPVWETTQTSQVTEVLRRVPILDAELLEKYLNYWKSIGFYKKD